MEYEIHLRKTDGRKIYVDPLETEGIYLYPTEIKKCEITDGSVLDDDTLEEIRKCYAVPRAKKRALGILAKRDKTESELREKLFASLTDSKSLEAAIAFVKEHGYLDDARYVRDYIYFKKGRKSYRMIRMELKQKGISEVLLDQIFEEEGCQSEDDVREKVIKYARKFETLDYMATQKILGHFYRKGYEGELIRGILKELQE